MLVRIMPATILKSKQHEQKPPRQFLPDCARQSEPCEQNPSAPSRCAPALQYFYERKRENFQNIENCAIKVATTATDHLGNTYALWKGTLLSGNEPSETRSQNRDDHRGSAPRNAGRVSVMKTGWHSRKIEWGQTDKVKIPLGVIPANLRYCGRVV
jgi:hypothetical protein